MRYILTIVLTAAVTYGIFIFHNKQLNCKLIGSTETLVVSDDAFLISNFKKGDTLSAVSFRSLNKGDRSDWEVNTGYSNGDTIYSVMPDGLTSHRKPIYIADQFRTVVVQ